MKFLFSIVIAALIGASITAQIPVAEEPLHHVIYEDDEVRVLEIIAIPGDTALVHRHDYNYCYIAVKGGILWLEDLGEESRVVALPTHYVGGKFELNKSPFVHRFANIDTVQIQFFTIEHKLGVPSREVSSILRDDIVLKDDLFTVRMLEIAPLSSIPIIHEGTTILLNLSSDPLLFSGEKAVPYWMHFAEDEGLHISNMSNTSILVAVFEIY